MTEYVGHSEAGKTSLVNALSQFFADSSALRYQEVRAILTASFDQRMPALCSLLVVSIYLAKTKRRRKAKVGPRMQRSSQWCLLATSQCYRAQSAFPTLLGSLQQLMYMYAAIVSVPILLRIHGLTWHRMIC